MPLTDIPDDFGTGGSGINPTGTEPTLKTLLVEHKEAIEDLQDNPVGGSTLTSDNAGHGILIDDSDPELPIISADAAEIGGCGAWAKGVYDIVKPLQPALTGWQYIKAAQNPVGATSVPSTSDGAVEGGGRTGASGQATYLTGSIFQAAKTGIGMIALRVRLLAAGAGPQSNYFGLLNVDASHDLVIGVFFSVASGTNFYFLADASTNTSDDLGANDLAFHTFILRWDVTNFYVYLDGVLVKTRAKTTNVVDEPLYFAILNTVSGETVWTDALYAYVPV